MRSSSASLCRPEQAHDGREKKMKDIVVAYKLTEDEVVRAKMMAIKSTSRFFRFMPWIGGVLLIFFVVGLLFSEMTVSEMIWVFIFGVVFLAIPIFIRWSARRDARKNPDLNNTITWHINDSELRNMTKGSEARFVWDKILKIWEKKEGFFIFTQPRIFFWIPKHGFQNENDIELFREIAKSKSLAYKS